MRGTGKFTTENMKRRIFGNFMLLDPQPSPFVKNKNKVYLGIYGRGEMVTK